MGSSYPGGVVEPRGPWHYDGEIDLGYGAALRMAATVLSHDSIFGWFAYGGNLAVRRNELAIEPRDGLRQRFYAVLEALPGPVDSRRFKMELDRDGFAAGKNIITDPELRKIAFTLENRTDDTHTTSLLLSPTKGADLAV